MAKLLTLGVIPSRWASSRFPGKPLHDIAGKTLIRRVWERCALCSELDHVVVATDDSRIAEEVERFGGQFFMTRADHPSGTDRIAEVAMEFPQHEVILNIQGDEPMISPVLIDQLAQALATNSQIDMITAANLLDMDDPAVADPNVVKVVLDGQGMALYFSRSQIPYPREKVEGLEIYRHKGIYGYRRECLLDFVSREPSILERVECLEQLRALDSGRKIKVLITDDDSPGIDTMEQAEILLEELRTTE